VSETRREYWIELIAEQEASAQTARAFCRERGIAEHAFYGWRRRLRKQPPVQFALLNTKPGSLANNRTPIELVLMSGERVLVGDSVNAETLRIVLEALRR
jgi:hypothetical protein